MKVKILAGLAAASMVGSLGFAGAAGAYGESCVQSCEPPAPVVCSFPPGGAVAPLHSTATPGGRALIYTICSNSGRGESRLPVAGDEFKGRTIWGVDVDPGGSQAKNKGGDS